MYVSRAQDKKWRDENNDRTKIHFFARARHFAAAVGVPPLCQMPAISCAELLNQSSPAVAKIMSFCGPTDAIRLACTSECQTLHQLLGKQQAMCLALAAYLLLRILESQNNELDISLRVELRKMSDPAQLRKLLVYLCQLNAFAGSAA